jgi:hypothetical protein
MISFVLVCQRGPLEVMSAICAASLRRHIQFPFEIVVAIAGQYGPLSGTSYDLLDSLEVRTVEIHNDFNPEYRIGNKLFAVNVDCDADVMVFLDSDILMMKNLLELGEEGKIHALPTPAYPKLHGHDRSHWESLYDYFGLDMKEPFRFYNSGFIVIPNGIGLQQKWIEYARRVHRASHDRKIKILPESPKSREYDQLSLSLTLSKYDDKLKSLLPFKRTKGCMNPDFWNWDCPDPIEYNMLINVCDYCWKEEVVPTFLAVQTHKYKFRPTGLQGKYMDMVSKKVLSLVKEHPKIADLPDWGEYVNRWLGIQTHFL